MHRIPNRHLALGAALLAFLVAGACTDDVPANDREETRDSSGSEVRALDTTDSDGDAGGESDTSGAGDTGDGTAVGRDVAADGDGRADTEAEPEDGGSADAAASRCTRDGERLRCAHRTATLLEDAAGSEAREVHWQVPTGRPPPQGWPVAIVFQGAFTSAETMWEAEPNDPYGRYHQVETFRALLESGVAVLTPEALGSGSTYWQTNVPPFATSWEQSADHEMMLALFDAVEAGTFGDLAPGRMYAAGFSSGGYMTSRMAVAYTDRFEALAIHSGSYARCSGSACYVPDDLPAGHPPTLFLHGENDTTVPVWTMRAYRDELREQDVSTRTAVDSSAGHGWIADAPEAIPEWFGRSR